MEVHHHPHVEKKGFKEYFLEFLMIFLAVTLGFFAESYREHLIDTEKAKDYMHNMVENLKDDTAGCEYILKASIVYNKRIDSFQYEIKEAINGNIHPVKLYYYYIVNRVGANYVPFNKSAITQMQSSGSLRLIKNDVLANEILSYYDRKITIPETNYSILLGERQQLKNTFMEFFSWKYFGDALNDTSFNMQHLQNYASAILNSGHSPSLLKSNTADFEKLYNDIVEFEFDLNNYYAMLRLTKQAAGSLMIHIQQEYHFNKNEK